MNSTTQYTLTIMMTFLFFHEHKAQEMDIERENAYLDWKTDSVNNPLKSKIQLLENPPVFIASETNNNEWWKLFGYERLNSLVSLALAENNNIRMAQSEIGIAKEEIKISKAMKMPTINLSPSVNRQQFSGNRPMPFDGPVEKITYNTYSLPLDISYEVDLFGKLKNEVKASQLNFEVASATREAIKLNIASDVSRYFFLLMVLDSELEILTATRKSREENLSIVEIRYEAGLTNEIDLHRAKTELSSVIVQMKNLEIERNNIELSLATLSGQPAQSFTIEKNGIRYAVPGISVNNNKMLSESRPDLAAAGFAVEANKERIKAARKNLYPSLYLGGSTGLLAGEYDQVFSGDSRNWFLGATYSVPIFEGGRRKALMHVSEYRLEKSISYLKQQTLLADQEAQQQLSALEKLNQQIEAQQEFLLAAKRAANLSQQRYLKGLVTYLEVVDAERIVLQAERLSVQLIGKQLLSSVDLLVAVGGDLTKVETPGN